VNERPEATSLRITLTERQKAQIREALGRPDVEIELEVVELEERVVPRLASNHNEAVLPDGWAGP
jgi:hypothetical protein